MLKEDTGIYVVVWSHKHGEDISLHKTEAGAEAKRLHWMRDTLESWGVGHQYYHISDAELHLHWTEISGESEFFSIDFTPLHD